MRLVLGAPCWALEIFCQQPCVRPSDRSLSSSPVAPPPSYSRIPAPHSSTQHACSLSLSVSRLSTLSLHAARRGGTQIHQNQNNAQNKNSYRVPQRRATISPPPPPPPPPPLTQQRRPPNTRRSLPHTRITSARPGRRPCCSRSSRRPSCPPRSSRPQISLPALYTS